MSFITLKRTRRKNFMSIGYGGHYVEFVVNFDS